MTDFTSGFWDVFIAVVTAVSIGACAVFLKSQSIRKARGTETTGHTWDEDLAEYNNPLPRWWSWLFYITIAFSIGYLVLYPGLGSSWKGTLGWTQVGQLEAEKAAADRQFGPLYDKFAAMDVEAMMKSPAALAVAQKLFLNNCAQCHASDGGGSKHFPNLADKEWLWGGDVKSIKATISDGRAGTMPPFGGALGEQGVKDAAHYVRSLSGLTHDSIRAARGEALFKQNCVGCHGVEGKGNPIIGSANLTDKIWLHGSSEQDIIHTITGGRSDRMPAHKELLSDTKISLLTAYVLSLSREK